MSQRQRKRVAPDVSEVVGGLETSRQAIITRLRSRVSALPGVTEDAVYDGFRREWTVAFYLGQRQLFHVHSFPQGLRATMFVGVENMELAIITNKDVPERLRQLVRETKAGHGLKQVRVPLHSEHEAEEFTSLVRAKWLLLQLQRPESNAKRHQRR